MIIVIITTIYFAVAVIILTSLIVLICVSMISIIVAIIVTFVTDCTMNVTIISDSGDTSISIPAPIRLPPLLLLVRVPGSAQ